MSKRIVLISCGSRKRDHPAIAAELYTGSLFRYSLEYARSLEPDLIFILSAKHGLVRLDQIIEPYDETLNKKSSAEITAWAESALNCLAKFCALDRDEFIVLAGDKYRKLLLPQMQNAKVPLKGLGIGKQLQYLKNATHK
jgi:hypothetical protein